MVRILYSYQYFFGLCEMHAPAAPALLGQQFERIYLFLEEIFKWKYDWFDSIFDTVSFQQTGSKQRSGYVDRSRNTTHNTQHNTIFKCNTVKATCSCSCNDNRQGRWCHQEKPYFPALVWLNYGESSCECSEVGGRFDSEESWRSSCLLGWCSSKTCCVSWRPYVQWHPHWLQ